MKKMFGLTPSPALLTITDSRPHDRISPDYDGAEDPVFRCSYWVTKWICDNKHGVWYQLCDNSMEHINESYRVPEKGARQVQVIDQETVSDTEVSSQSPST